VTAPDLLVPGFTRGPRSSYRGALRDNPRNNPEWICTHEHLLPAAARRCAQGERERRMQGASEVLELSHCKPCATWWEGLPSAVCPWCDVPVERVKVIVLERGPS
jgi:hypothetical protein